MKKFQLISLMACHLLLSCDPGSQEKSVSTNDADKVVRPDKAIDSSAFELLISKIDDPERKNWQNPDLVIQQLGDLQDKTVVDIGAGTGYFTFRLAPLAEKIIAVDIEKRFLDVIESRKTDLEPEWAEKIDARLTREDDPSIREGEADVVLIVNTYHFLHDRISYLKKVRKGMKQNGIILIVDFKNAEMEVAPPGDLVVPEETAVSELAAGGFKNIKVDHASLKYQYIIKANS